MLYNVRSAKFSIIGGSIIGLQLYSPDPKWYYFIVFRFLTKQQVINIIANHEFLFSLSRNMKIA